MKKSWGCAFFGKSWLEREIVVGQREKSCRDQTLFNLKNVGGGRRFLLHLISLPYFLLYSLNVTKI